MFILEALEHYAETDRIAIRYHDEKVSFSALNRMADAFAAYLRRTLPSDGRPVMIYGHKQSAIPACMFGALKAGRGYIPVDTTYPTDRAAQILRDAQPSVLVDLRTSGLSAEHTLCGGEEQISRLLRLDPTGADGLSALHLRLDRDTQGRADHSGQSCRIPRRRKTVVCAAAGGRRVSQ